MVLHFCSVFLRFYFLNLSKIFYHSSTSSRREMVTFQQREACIRYFNQFRIFWDFNKIRQIGPKKIILPKVSSTSGELIIIWMEIIGGIYCLWNEYEQIYLFVDISSSKSYQLTEMSSNLRNCTFSGISDPGIKCFAPK